MDAPTDGRGFLASLPRTGHPMIRSLLLALPLLLASQAAVAAPRVDAAAQAAASRVSSLPDTDPVARINMVLEAAKLDDNALFVLAQTHPSIAEHLSDKHIKMTVDYLRTIPATELHRIRRGETVIRPYDSLRGPEKKAALALAEKMGFPKFKEKKLASIRMGPIEARVFRLEITYNKTHREVVSETVDMAWPSTPERDEDTRDRLARYFGARPTRMAGAPGTPLPLEDGSFENPDTLGVTWELGEGVILGTDLPVSEVAVDADVALDGTHSLRFNSTQATRRFPEVLQHVPVQPGTPVLLRAQFRAQNLRVEYQQREDQVGLSLTWLDSSGYPVGPAVIASGRLTSHPWELLEIREVAPQGATMARVGLLSAVSGTSWFDGVTLVVSP